MFQNWWSSLETLRSLSSVTTRLIVIFGVLVTIATVAHFLFNARFSNVRKEMAAFRKLSSDQIEAMKSILFPFAGTEVNIIVPDDEEIRSFAGDIRKAFNQSGWKVKTLRGGRRKELKNLNFVVPDKTKLGPSERSIMEAFQEANVTYELAEGSTGEIGADERRQPFIMVGFKPERLELEQLEVEGRLD